MSRRREFENQQSWGIGLFLAVLAGVALYGSRDAVTPMDFYQFWFVTRTDIHEVSRPYSRDAQTELSRQAEIRLNDPATGALEQRTLARIDEVFEPLADGRMIQSTGTPLLYAMAAVISTDSFELSGRIAHGVILFAYVAALVMLQRMLRFSSTRTIGYWFVLWSAFLPASFDVYYGNVAGVQMAMLIGVIHGVVSGRWALAGGLAALTALFKPTAAYPVVALTVYVLALGDWRATAKFVVGGLSGGVVALALTAWAFGTPAVWIDWFTLMLPQVAETNYALMNGNCGANSLIVELTGLRYTALLTALIFVPVLIVAAARGWSDARAEDLAAKPALRSMRITCLISAATAAMLLTAPLTWQHYYVLLIPGMVALAVHPVFRFKLLALAAMVCLSRLSFSGLGGTGLQGAIVTALLYATAASTVLVGSVKTLSSGLQWPRLSLPRLATGREVTADLDAALSR